MEYLKLLQKRIDKRHEMNTKLPLEEGCITNYVYEPGDIVKTLFEENTLDSNIFKRRVSSDEEGTPPGYFRNIKKYLNKEKGDPDDG
jgi:hypothetical protein